MKREPVKCFMQAILTSNMYTAQIEPCVLLWAGSVSQPVPKAVLCNQHSNWLTLRTPLLQTVKIGDGYHVINVEDRGLIGHTDYAVGHGGIPCRYSTLELAKRRVQNSREVILAAPYFWEKIWLVDRALMPLALAAGFRVGVYGSNTLGWTHHMIGLLKQEAPVQDKHWLRLFIYANDLRFQTEGFDFTVEL